jgi:ABC-type antimicrobial peptide transport system permease subunit
MGAPTVAIVNQAFLRRYAPERNLVGSQLSYDKRILTIVGVVEDVPDRSLRRDAEPVLFTALAQMRAGAFGWAQLTLVIRSRHDELAALRAAVSREIWAVDPNIVIDEVASMDERVAASLKAERHVAILFGVFALAAVAIAAIGVYGVAAFAAAQRTREFGIRIALGAAARDLTRLVMSQTLGPTVAGIAAGLAIAAGITRVIDARLYGVTPLDPTSLIAAAVLLLAAALGANYVPTRRALRVDPVMTLRSD